MENIYNAIQNVYNMDKTTWQEVLAELYNLVSKVENKFDLFELKFGQLLGEEVTRELKKIYDDGSLGSLINDKLLKDINTKVDAFKTEVSEQMETVERLKATKQELEVERKRIDSFAKLSEGSTTGDAELIDGRVGVDGEIYSNIGDAIRSQINNISDEIGYEFNIDYSDNIVKGKYINSNGNEISIDVYNYVKMLNVHGLYSVTLINAATDGNACVVAYNEDKTLIGKINKSGWTPSTETIVLSENVHYISISYSTSYTLTVVGRGIKYVLDTCKNKIDSVVDDIFEFPLPSPKTNKKINASGEIVTTSIDASAITYIPIKPNTEITLENIMVLNSNDFCYAYYDENFKFIQVGTDKNWEVITITETTPTNAYYVSITYKNGNVPRVYTKDLTVYKDIDNYSLDKYKDTTIIWVDDDTNKTGIEYVYSACENKGVNATLACLPNKFSEDRELKLRLLEMEEQGLEIVLHGYSHGSDIWSNDNTDEKSVIADITKGFRELKDFQNYRHLVTPNGANSEMIKRVAKRFSPCLVSAWEGINKKECGDNSRYDLGRYWMTNHTLEEFKTVIDKLRPKNDLLILATHSAPNVAPWDTEKIESMLQYVKDKGYNIVTLSEGILYFFGS